MAFGDLVQTALAQTGSGSTITATLGATATAGNLLVLHHEVNTNNTVAPTEGGWSEGYSVDEPIIVTRTTVWFKVADGTEDTATPGTAAPSKQIGILAEFEGPWSSAVADVTANGLPRDTSTTHSSGTTAVASQDVYIAFAFYQVQNAFTAFDTFSNSFTKVNDHANDAFSSGCAYIARSAAQAEECTATHTNQPGFGGIVTFAPSGATRTSIHLFQLSIGL
jgi:hypothetical protein